MPHHGFAECSLSCHHCLAPLAKITTMKAVVPRRALTSMAKMSGSVQNHAGDWFCGRLCRMLYRMEKDVAEREMPKCD